MNGRTLAKLTLSVIFSTAIAGFLTATFALSVKKVPNSRQIDGSRVKDICYIFNPTTETKINRQLSPLLAKDSDKITLVTAPSNAPTNFHPNVGI